MTGAKVCTIGIWHLGAVTSGGLASLGYHVTGVDPDPERVKQLNQGIPPLFEPGLDTLLAENLSVDRLRFDSDLTAAVDNADYVLLTFDTPVNDRDEVDLGELFATCERFAPYLAEGATLVVISQVPLGTCEELAAVIRKANPRVSFGTACVPENLRLGEALQRFFHPDMIVIGADSAATAERVECLFAPIEAPKLRVSLRTAEMTKHAINTFLATSISFINEIANLCELTGADAVQVGKALRLDARIGPRAPLNPGLGFSGGTLARDLKSLLRLAERHSYEGSLLRGVLAVNERRNLQILEKLQAVHGSLHGLTVGVLGLTYKAGTSTMRRSAPMEIVTSLLSQGAKVKAFDPRAEVTEALSLPGLSLWDDAYALAAGCDALILLTAWPEFRDLDLARLKSTMNYPLFLDPNNTLDAEKMAALGFRYVGTGRAPNA